MSTSKNFARSDWGNPDLNELVEKMTELLKVSAVQAMNAEANPETYRTRSNNIALTGPEGDTVSSVATVVVEKFHQLDSQALHALRLDLGRDTELTEQIRHLGVNIEEEREVPDQLDIQQHFSFINGTSFSEDRMKAMLSDLADAPAGGGRSSERDTAGTNVALNFRIHKVECIDKVNPERWGKDEISWGGISVDAKGVTEEVQIYRVGRFNDGDGETYSPPQIIKTFNLGLGEFPQTYLVIMSLAERDSGQLSAFIENLYNAIEDDLKKVLKALGAAAGAAIAVPLGALGVAIGGALGNILGIVAGAILTALVAWMVKVFKDDIFPPQTSKPILLESPSSTFPEGSLISAVKQLNFRDRGGHYQISYDWEIIR